MRKLIHHYLMIVSAIALATLFSNDLVAAEDKGATEYVKRIAATALGNSEPTAKRVASWTEIFGREWDFDYLISHGLKKSPQLLTDADRDIVRTWAVSFAMAPEGRFMELIKKSVMERADVGQCEPRGAVCESRVRVKRKFDSDLQFIVHVIRRAGDYRVNEIVYNDTFSVRDPLAKAFSEAYASGALKLQTARK